MVRSQGLQCIIVLLFCFVFVCLFLFRLFVCLFCFVLFCFFLGGEGLTHVLPSVNRPSIQISNSKDLDACEPVFTFHHQPYIYKKGHLTHLIIAQIKLECQDQIDSTNSPIIINYKIGV